MNLKPSFSCSLFIKSVWALLGLTEQARVLVDRSWFQGFGFYLFFNKIVECVGFTIIYYDQGDSLLSKTVLCDADFNEYVGYIFNLIYYARVDQVRPQYRGCLSEISSQPQLWYRIFVAKGEQS